MQRANVSCRHCNCRDPYLANVDVDNPPVDRESDGEKTKTGGESPTKKRKLDRLKRPDDVDYNSEDSAKGSSKGGKGLRPQKQRKLPASREDSPPGFPSATLTLSRHTTGLIVIPATINTTIATVTITTKTSELYLPRSWPALPHRSLLLFAKLDRRKTRLATAATIETSTILLII